jgi:hypothetical protein
MRWFPSSLPPPSDTHVITRTSKQHEDNTNHQKGADNNKIEVFHIVSLVITQFTDKYPNEPQAGGHKDHENIKTKIEETVTSATAASLTITHNFLL